MAEGTEGTSAGSWFGSMINSAKSKTSTVFEAVKKDLGEISSAVRTEASSVGAAIESTLKFDQEDSTVGTVKKSLSTFFGQISEVLMPNIEDDEQEDIVIPRDGIESLSGFLKHLAELQSNDKTYLIEPEYELADKYKRWMEVVEQDQFTQERLAKQMASSEILNDKYVSLVPDKISHMEFWQRYLFKRALLEDALANAERAEQCAKVEISSTKPMSPRKNIIQTEQPKLACKDIEIAAEVADTANVADVADVSEDVTNKKSLDEELLEDDLNWGVEEETTNVELSEEEQIRLLEQYDKEIQEREKRKSIILTEDASNGVKDKESKKNIPSATKKSTDKGAHKPNSKQQPKSAQPKRNVTTANSNNKNNPKDAQNQNNSAGKATKIQQKSKGVMQIQKNHFKKDESSSTSDESWEKDFDLND